MARASRVVVLICLVLLQACAVRNNPNVTTLTKVELNMSHQLQQAEEDYKNFFIGVGKAKAQGVLTSQQIDRLVVIGNSVKTTLENANGKWKVYMNTKEEGLLRVVQALLDSALIDMIQLQNAKTQMLKEGQ